MMMTAQSHNRRWYDGIGDMAMAMHISRQLPDTIRTLIAENLNETIDRYRQEQRRQGQPLSLGPHRVMHLYKAGRRRWYDDDPYLHRAFTLMGSVPEQYLSELAGRIMTVSHSLGQVAYGPYESPADMEEILRQVLRENREGIRLAAEYTEPLHPRHIGNRGNKRVSSRRAR